MPSTPDNGPLPSNTSSKPTLDLKGATTHFTNEPTTMMWIGDQSKSHFAALGMTESLVENMRKTLLVRRKVQKLEREMERRKTWLQQELEDLNAYIEEHEMVLSNPDSYPNADFEELQDDLAGMIEQRQGYLNDIASLDRYIMSTAQRQARYQRLVDNVLEDVFVGCGLLPGADEACRSERSSLVDPGEPSEATKFGLQSQREESIIVGRESEKSLRFIYPPEVDTQAHDAEMSRLAYELGAKEAKAQIAEGAFHKYRRDMETEVPAPSTTSTEHDLQTLVRGRQLTRELIDAHAELHAARWEWRQCGGLLPGEDQRSRFIDDPDDGYSEAQQTFWIKAVDREGIEKWIRKTAHGSDSCSSPASDRSTLEFLEDVGLGESLTVKEELEKSPDRQRIDDWMTKMEAVRMELSTTKVTMQQDEDTKSK
ncbi:hypothetical protein IWZ01DRAFT_481859 [Phyllosticta capitalensis]